MNDLTISKDNLDDKVYIDKTTRNKNFLDFCEKFNKVFGIEPSPVLLRLCDTSLIGVDPYDETLDEDTKIKILQECIRNPIYLLREILRDSNGNMFDMDMPKFIFLYCNLWGVNTYFHHCKYATQRDDFSRAVVKMGRIASYGQEKSLSHDKFLIVTKKPEEQARKLYGLPDIGAFRYLSNLSNLGYIDYIFLKPEDINLNMVERNLVGAIVEDVGNIPNLTVVVDDIDRIIQINVHRRYEPGHTIDFQKKSATMRLFQNIILVGDKGADDVDVAFDGCILDKLMNVKKYESKSVLYEPVPPLNYYTENHYYRSHSFNNALLTLRETKKMALLNFEYYLLDDAALYLKKELLLNKILETGNPISIEEGPDIVEIRQRFISGCLYEIFLKTKIDMTNVDYLVVRKFIRDSWNGITPMLQRINNIWSDVQKEISSEDSDELEKLFRKKVFSDKK